MEDTPPALGYWLLPFEFGLAGHMAAWLLQARRCVIRAETFSTLAWAVALS